MGTKSKKQLITAGIFSIMVIAAIICGWRWYECKVEPIRALQAAMSDPESLNSEVLLDKIDSSFAALPDADRKKIMSDPKTFGESIENASYKTFKESFGGLFMLPESIRKKVIQSSADALAEKAKDKENFMAFYESEAGKAALRAATKYFLLELDGKQKAELAPLMNVFFGVHKELAEDKK